MSILNGANAATLVFVDTKTTGLELDADIWEFAAVRRAPSGQEAILHLFIEHDPAKCWRLPESFAADHQSRFPACHGATTARSAMSQIYDPDAFARHTAMGDVEWTMAVWDTIMGDSK